jgi:ribose 5-phosphate isomerase A
MTDNRDRLKQAAAEAAAAQVKDGMVVGLGTGSTAAFAIDALIHRVADGLDIHAIPTSKRSAAQASAGGIRLTDFAAHPRIDLTIDGADQVDVSNLNLIKGMGGALLREKIVAAASDQLLIIVDEAKLADSLSLAVPVEVTPFGWEATAGHISRLGGAPVRRVAGNGEAFVTDGGGYILDCAFGAIVDAAALDSSVREIVGVIETGLFIGMTSSVIVAGAGGVRELRPRESHK